MTSARETIIMEVSSNKQQPIEGNLRAIFPILLVFYVNFVFEYYRDRVALKKLSIKRLVEANHPQILLIQ